MVRNVADIVEHFIGLFNDVWTSRLERLECDYVNHVSGDFAMSGAGNKPEDRNRDDT